MRSGGQEVDQVFEQARGNVTSMISLVIPPKGQVSLIQKMLTEEYLPHPISSLVSTDCQCYRHHSHTTKIKLYNSVPKNGLVLYCGDVLTDEGKEKKLNYDFEPFKPINTSLTCVTISFHVEALSELL